MFQNWEILLLIIARRENMPLGPKFLDGDSIFGSCRAIESYMD